MYEIKTNGSYLHEKKPITQYATTWHFVYTLINHFNRPLWCRLHQPLRNSELKLRWTTIQYIGQHWN